MPHSECLILRPSEIRFTQDSISEEFGHDSGESLEQTFRKLLYGEKNCDKIRRMGVVMWNSKYWVVSGNRRLYVFRKLEEAGRVDEITVNKYNIDMDKFKKMKTTKDEGRSVRIRGNEINLEYQLTQIVTEWKRRGRPTTGLLAARNIGPSSRTSNSYSSPGSPVCNDTRSAQEYEDSTRKYGDFSTTSNHNMITTAGPHKPRTEPRSTGAGYQSNAVSGSTTTTSGGDDHRGDDFQELENNPLFLKMKRKYNI